MGESLAPGLGSIGKADGNVCGRYAVAVCISRFDDL
jgi:hypothetical protein